ncbi:hypothetical protein IU433_22170 [Nocardia puris]|uniref:hypothetical protein n=1 Tax=Nocardia TaxID=1817 RepID=UPI0011DE46DF|nr:MULTISPECIES: hypothetical protein [Nocardia]MBF6137226.1 hypothetical protein [Nocardia otitidiscaviarum]MBF6181830.1 hypothetical protein [Nocardia otitidiscaviarum]MBF6461723.1 hypothetical protein [Nocardia puris]MBF6488124.1 hypothetical protein [Nocardia otitidiscaviarum]
MSNTRPSDSSEALRAIRTLVQAQNLRAAKQQLRQLQNDTDDATWSMIVEIANTLRFKTHTVALTKLRKLWRDNEQFRPLIEACVPKPDERRDIPPQPSPQSIAADGYRASEARAGKVAQRIDPDKRIDPNRRSRSPNTKVIDDYERNLARDERDDPGTPRPELIVDRHDYDRDVFTHVRTTLCVSCRLERAAIDHHTERVQAGLGDDGLCGECRSLGRPGLPPLASGHTLADQVHARLDYLAEHFTTADRGIFRQEYRYGNRHTRPIISAWVKANTTAGPEPPRPIIDHDGPSVNDWCTQCEEFRYIAYRDHRRGERVQLCLDCDPRNKDTLVPAGSIEVRHSRYQREIRDAASKDNGEQTAPERVQGGREVGAGQPPTSKAVAADATPSPAKSTAPPQTTGAINALEKARTAAQERRRTVGRPAGGGMATKRSVRR